MKKNISDTFEEEYVIINENNPINQYILHYKVESAKVILFIHGGPGMSQSVFGYFLKEIFSDNFSLVFYDQRGAGRTLMKNPKQTPTLNALLEDLQYTVNYLKKKYNTEKNYNYGSFVGKCVRVHLFNTTPRKYFAFYFYWSSLQYDGIRNY